jgi:S-adenosylmethionine:tRNA ribosyltransferase-isomerase
MKPEILMKDYWYDLPEERIALFPLPQRDQSRLLLYRDGRIEHAVFNQISRFIPSGSTLFFNDTKVIPARLFFQKDSGALIELFLLHPIDPGPLVQQAMEAKEHCEWVCTIGNLKRWKSGILSKRVNDELTITAEIVDRPKGIIRFTWNPSHYSFAEVINEAGTTPLPPYLKREVTESDRQRYQTVYSHQEGAVAAPTAGLHFTENIINDLRRHGHAIEFLTLHVSAGTFQPVKSANAAEHTMHEEQMVVTRENISALLSAQHVVAVGTTSLRTLESLYWFGVKLITKGPHTPFIVEQQDPYQNKANISLPEALRAILTKMDYDQTEAITGETSIYILPGYNFQVVDALITNFHQPGSTLILLVAAFAGKDWRKIYQEALYQGYRFLSYGDSSLLFRKRGG